MEAPTLEQSSGDASPVFVAGGRRRSHAVRLAAATLGLLLAGWLAALVAGLVGFSPLPKLTFPGTGAARAPAVAPERAPRPATEHDAGSRVSPITSSPARRGGQPNVSATGASSAPGVSGSAGGAAGAQAAGQGAGPTSPDSGAGDPQAPAPSGDTASPANAGHPPSFTPPASREKSANPPRGNSADAPGSAVSADPPGRAARPHSG